MCVVKFISFVVFLDPLQMWIQCVGLGRGAEAGVPVSVSTRQQSHALASAEQVSRAVCDG